MSGLAGNDTFGTFGTSDTFGTFSSIWALSAASELVPVSSAPIAAAVVAHDDDGGGGGGSIVGGDGKWEVVAGGGGSNVVGGGNDGRVVGGGGGGGAPFAAVSHCWKMFSEAADGRGGGGPGGPGRDGGNNMGDDEVGKVGGGVRGGEVDELLFNVLRSSFRLITLSIESVWPGGLIGSLGGGRSNFPGGGGGGGLLGGGPGSGICTVYTIFVTASRPRHPKIISVTLQEDQPVRTPQNI